jgi:predicted nucleotide-binding protein (sugar kinase/HSP70/actin superfamily)
MAFYAKRKRNVTIGIGYNSVHGSAYSFFAKLFASLAIRVKIKENVEKEAHFNAEKKVRGGRCARTF